MTHLFNLSIKLGELPDVWKTARVSPIPKSRNQSGARNYRPISLLSVLSKLLEKHVRNLLIRHFEECHPIFAQQWGFTKGKSTTGALLDATDQWFRLMEQGHDICTVYIDYDVHPQILRLIGHYLCARKQYVCVNGSSSDMLPVTSGVPQGSVLGPLLFNIYIDDITSVPLSNGSMLLYADDIMLYRPIYAVVDYELLQLDINQLCSWTDSNLLKFNSDKCKYMIISRRKQPSLTSNNSGGMG